MDLLDLEKDLPPVISRSQIDKLLGGIISGRTIANADSRAKDQTDDFISAGGLLTQPKLF